MVFLVKENVSLCKVNLTMNLINSEIITEIEKICKRNQKAKIGSQIPEIMREIKAFKKIKEDFKQIDSIEQEMSDNKIQMGNHMGTVNKVETMLEGQRFNSK